MTITFPYSYVEDEVAAVEYWHVHLDGYYIGQLAEWDEGNIYFIPAQARYQHLESEVFNAFDCKFTISIG